MFKLAVGDTVLFPVKGSLLDDDGNDVPFDFALRARRDTQGQVAALQTIERDVQTADYLAERVTDWQGVLAADGTPSPFSRDALCCLFDVPNLANLSFQAYLAAIAVRGKV